MSQTENIFLYPEPSAVFKDPALALYFKPLLTHAVNVNNKDYQIHLFSRDGLICKEEPIYQYSENYCFGFRYNDGKYEFLGDLQVFEETEKLSALHQLLQQDFDAKKDEYLKNKTTVKEYLEAIRKELEDASRFGEYIYAEIYARSFYSYEFTRYYYRKYGAHRHISVVTEQWAKNTDPFLLDEDDAQDMLEEWFEGFDEDTESKYGISTDMFAGGTESRRFTALAGSSVVFALVDAEKDIVYMVEYTS